MAPYTRGRKRFNEGKEEKSLSSSEVEVVGVKIYKKKKVAKGGHHHHGSSSSPVEATTKFVGHHGSSSSSSPPVEATTKFVGHHGSSSPVEATAEKPKPKPVYLPTIRWISEEEALRYGRQVRGSRGFDVDKYFGHFSGYNLIRPVLGDVEYNRELRKFCNIAIKHYKQNVSKDTNFQFVIVKANYCTGRYCDYYITFEARDAASNDQVKTFEAQVIVDYVGGEPVEVELCRLKSTPTPTP